MTALTIGAERRRHPVYRYRAVYWATVYRDGNPIAQLGPYRHKHDALYAAQSMKDRREKEMRQPHTPGPRVDLPGQLEIPDTVQAPSTLAGRLAAAPMRPDKPQKACDHGLFSDDAKQPDLF